VVDVAHASFERFRRAPRRRSIATRWEIRLASAPKAVPGGDDRVAFASGGPFLRSTRSEVAAYLADPGTRARGRRRLHAKAAAFIGLMLVSWLLVIAAPDGRLALAAAVLVGVGAFLTALGVQHDANHGAFFGRRRYDRWMGWTSDALLGFSSYAWRARHNVGHHTYTNIDGHDPDIGQDPIIRLARSQRPHPWHRLQPYYAWPLYCLMAIRLQTFGDVSVMLRGRVGNARMRRPRGWDLVALVGGKLVFATWAIAVPMLVYPWWAVVSVYLVLVMAMSLGMVMVFQLAHCVEQAEFPTAATVTSEHREWAVHEMETTVDFSPGSPIATFALGGLNYQIEHHLFPQVPHTHYRAIAEIVRRNAERYGVRYSVNPTFGGALRSHWRHLRTMGRLGLPVEIDMG
jgi:linoleoyl-CoA desaturase